MTQVSTAPRSLHRSEPEALTQWLREVPWQIFGTFTFAWRVSDAQALKVFHEFVNRLEKSMREPIAYVRGDEKRFSGCGMPGAPRHYHALLTAHRWISPTFVTDLWMSLAGRRANGAGADARVYDPSLPGLAYALKFINEPDGDWDFRNLDLFLQTSAQHATNHRVRRRLSRHLRRMEAK